MLLELCEAIQSKYDTLSYGSGLLKDTAPLWFGVAKDGESYPFVSYYIIDGRISSFTTCSDSFDYLVQFSVFDKGKTPINAIKISDAIVKGFNSASLSGLEGDLVNLQPLGQSILEEENNNGHVGIVEFGVFIENQR